MIFGQPACRLAQHEGYCMTGSDSSPRTAQPIKPGAKNLLSDVGGLRVGHAHNVDARTGVTVILPDAAAVAACAIPGGGPGTRETDALQPANLVDRVDALVLAGGSVYGLDAASGVTAELGAQGRGFQTGAPIVSPIVPAAILFDLANGGDKSWGTTPPYEKLGRSALAACDTDFALGNAGAAYGAQAGQIKGGLGSASVQMADGSAVAALVAANPVGAVCDTAGRFWAQPLALMHGGGLEYGYAALAGQAADAQAHPMQGGKLAAALPGTNTSIGVVAVSADLTVAEAQRVAMMAQDGLARAIRPIHTPFDGDALFVLATGETALADEVAMRPLKLAELGALAADCVARAVCRGVWLADDLGDIPAYRSHYRVAID